MPTQQEAMILIAASDAQAHVDTSKPVEDQVRAAMEVTKDFWMSTDEEVRFRGAVAAVLLKNQGNEEVVERINTEMRALNSLAAMMGGVPVDMERAIPPEGFKPIGIRNLWMEIGHPSHRRS